MATDFLAPPHPPPTVAGSPLLAVSGLRKHFGPLEVLAGVDLEVHAGEVVALVGENGAGKSTLVRCLAGDLMPDAGEVRIDGGPLGRSPAEVAAQDVAVVWQDLAMCEDLDVVANLFLGRERRGLFLSEVRMHREAREILGRLGLAIPDLTRPLRTLSGGQRQLVAIARALHDDPRLMILDEPTSNLAVAQSHQIADVIRELRRRGTGVLIVTHDLDQACALSDRIIVLRKGRRLHDLSPTEVRPDDVAALMSGIEADSTARRQLQRLQSLGDQLAEVAPSGALPLIVSSMADAMGQESLCVHLPDTAPDGRPVLRRSAAVGLPDALLAANAVLDIGLRGGSVGMAAETGETVIIEDVRTHPAWVPLRRAALDAGILSAWAAPIITNEQVIGTVSGYGDAVGRLTQDQLELLTVYTGYAAAAIERDQALETLTRRNTVLESLRSMLETLAGPERLRGGLDTTLWALAGGLNADAVLFFERDGDGVLHRRAGVDTAGDEAEAARTAAALERAVAERSPDASRARLVGPATVVVSLQAPGGGGALATHWRPPRAPGPEALALLDDAARSLQLAIEREDLDAAMQEAAALRRSGALQRGLLQRLSHELRTPLTAVHGFASTLLQTDVVWDDASEHRFLTAIATESERLRRLVGDLLDSSALETGILRLNPDWCDLALLARAAVDLMPAGRAITVEVAGDEPPVVWGDHDRLQQVLVNLLDNAVAHTEEDVAVCVRIELHAAADAATVRVSDTGPGIPPERAATLFDPHVRGPRSGGTGLGLTIARGIVEAHGGTLTIEPGPGTTFAMRIPVEATPDRLRVAGEDGDG